MSEEGGECPVFIATAPCRRAPAVGVWQSSVSGRCRLSNLILPSAKYPFNNFIYDDDNNSPLFRLFLCFIAVATRLIFILFPNHLGQFIMLLVYLHRVDQKVSCSF